MKPLLHSFGHFVSSQILGQRSVAKGRRATHVTDFRAPPVCRLHVAPGRQSQICADRLGMYSPRAALSMNHSSSFVCQISGRMLSRLVLDNWVPTTADVEILRVWLLQPLHDLRNGLSRVLLSHMNWSMHPASAPAEGYALLSLDLHRSIALIIAEATAVHMPPGKEPYVQVLPSTLNTRDQLRLSFQFVQAMQQTSKKAFSSWAFHVLGMLHLHILPPLDISHPICLPLRQVQ
jgi:hypothetical protein